MSLHPTAVAAFAFAARYGYTINQLAAYRPGKAGSRQVLIMREHVLAGRGFDSISELDAALATCCPPIRRSQVHHRTDARSSASRQRGSDAYAIKRHARSYGHPQVRSTPTIARPTRHRRPELPGGPGEAVRAPFCADRAGVCGRRGDQRNQWAQAAAVQTWLIAPNAPLAHENNKARAVGWPAASSLLLLAKGGLRGGECARRPSGDDANAGVAVGGPG